QSSCLANLPVGVLVNVCMFLNAKDVVNLAQTSALFNFVTSHQVIWKHLCIAELGSSSTKLNKVDWKNEYIARMIEKNTTSGTRRRITLRRVFIHRRPGQMFLFPRRHHY